MAAKFRRDRPVAHALARGFFFAGFALRWTGFAFKSASIAFSKRFHSLGLGLGLATVVMGLSPVVDQ